MRTMRQVASSENRAATSNAGAAPGGAPIVECGTARVRQRNSHRSLRIVHLASRPMTHAPPRYAAAGLVAFARALLERAGVRTDMSADVADVLVTGDLLGHTTHGLALLAPYLAELEKGSMAKAGAPTLVNARPAAQAWDGGRLPGPWLTLRALDKAAEMAATHGTGTVVIRRSHHIACLAAYLLRATERGLVAIVQSSDPIVAAVVPHGGLTPVVTPNPIAAGLPTSGDPILIDISSSITSMGFAKQEMNAGRKLPGPWVLDKDGNATDDPGALYGEPKGALLPLGGLDAGYKGFGLALLIEALTAGLAGFGRADPAEGWGGTAFVQVLDPQAFGGLGEFRRQMDHMVAVSHASKPRPGVERVRVPGEAGMRRLREQRAAGVALYPTILPALATWAEKFGVPMPQAIA
jgi:L-lactate dehydrogenase